MGELVRIERDGGVAVIRMARTEKHNAFNRELSDAVRAAFDDVERDASIVCTVLTGSGTAFSAGADMTEAIASIEGTGRSEGMYVTLERIARYPKPLIGCINGIAYGGGALVATLCDVRVASDQAAFRFPGAAYGLVVGASHLPRIIGPAYAKELLFTARVVKADEALRMGLVNSVVPHAHAEAAAMEMARQVAANSLEALIGTKETIDRATHADDGIDTEARWNLVLRESPEHHRRFREATERVARKP